MAVVLPSELFASPSPAGEPPTLERLRVQLASDGRRLESVDVLLDALPLAFASSCALPSSVADDCVVVEADDGATLPLLMYRMLGKCS